MLIRRQTDIPFDQDAASRLLPWIVAIMIYLSGMAIAGAIALNGLVTTWSSGLSGALTSDMVDDEDRTMTLRLDQVWTAAVAAEWQWTDDRSVEFSVSYIGIDDAPVETPAIPGVGSLEGEFTSRDTWLFQLLVNWGSL